METNPFPRKRIPSLLLERWRLGELDDAEKSQLISEFGESHITKALAALDSEELAYRQAVLPKSPLIFNQDARDAVPIGKKSAPTLWRYLAPLLMAALALIVINLPSKKPEASADLNDQILLKGNSAPLQIFKQGPQGIMPLEDSAEVKPGDLIQLVYNAENFNYAVIVSFDGNGDVTWHFPKDATGSSKLEHGRPIGLNDSFRLDAAPRYERFFFLRSMTPIVDLDFKRYAKTIDFSKATRIPTDEAIDQFSMILRK